MVIKGQKISNKALLIAGTILVVFVAAGFLLPKGSGLDGDFKAIPKVDLTLPAIGLIPDLKTAMGENADLRARVDLLMTYDELSLFTNYREVNSLVSEIIFLWSGLTLEQLRSMNANQAIEFFLRRSHGLSPDRPIKNNPYLGDRPWPKQFNRMKARLLMMGQGKKVYDGRAYFDSAQRRMVVEAEISKRFVKDFSKFLKTQNEPKRFRNNFLVFVDETKGFKSLSDEERSLINQL
jgi:hypothetical protein